MAYKDQKCIYSLASNCSNPILLYCVCMWIVYTPKQPTTILIFFLLRYDVFLMTTNLDISSDKSKLHKRSITSKHKVLHTTQTKER